MTGFESKREAAADKLLEEATRSCNNIDEQRALDALMREAQSAQEPVECLDCGSHNVGIPATYDSLVDSVKAQPAQEQHWNEDEWRRNNWRCGHGWLRGEQCEICNAWNAAPESAKYLRSALDAFGPDAGISLDQKVWSKLHAAIKAVITPSAQEPTGVLHIERLDKWLDASLKERKQREWVGLTEQERNNIEDDFYANISIHVFDAIEAKLKEKNT